MKKILLATKTWHSVYSTGVPRAIHAPRPSPGHNPMPATTADEMLLSLCQSNIARFERLLAEAEGDEKRATFVELIAEERATLKRLVPGRQPVEGFSGPPGPL